MLALTHCMCGVCAQQELGRGRGNIPGGMQDHGHYPSGGCGAEAAAVAAGAVATELRREFCEWKRRVEEQLEGVFGELAIVKNCIMQLYNVLLPGKFPTPIPAAQLQQQQAQHPPAHQHPQPQPPAQTQPAATTAVPLLRMQQHIRTLPMQTPSLPPSQQVSTCCPRLLFNTLVSSQSCRFLRKHAGPALFPTNLSLIDGGMYVQLTHFAR